MPRIMRPCRPEHSPSEEWGEDTSVQWGARGLVISTQDPSRSRITAFFEAFPATGSGFIRGEGATVAEAEEAALAARRREMACDEHAWSRKRYTNGGGICRRCGAWNSNAFRPIVRLGEFRRPAHDANVEMLLAEDFVDLTLHMARAYPNEERMDRPQWLRLRRLGVLIPEPVEGRDLREWAEASASAAREWARGLDEEGIARLSDPEVLRPLMGGLLLRDLIERIRELRGEGSA